EFGHAVIRHLRQLDRLRGRGESLDGRVGQRDDLAIILHLVHRAEARLEIPDIAHGFHALGDAEIAAHRLQCARDLRRQDVSVDVDEHETRPALFCGRSLVWASGCLNLLRTGKLADGRATRSNIEPPSTTLRSAQDEGLWRMPLKIFLALSEVEGCWMRLQRPYKIAAWAQLAMSSRRRECQGSGILVLEI